MRIEEIQVPLLESPVRLDKFLSEYTELELTRNAVQKTIEEGGVTLSGKILSKSLKLKGGEILQIQIPDPIVMEARPENIPLEIVYEDDDVLVVNKPRGMVVHPAAGHPSGTLVNALLYHCGERLSGIGGVLRPGIVHRIDKDTSGLLMIAKNDKAHQGLAEQIANHSFQREYLCVLWGHLKESKGTISLPIGRSPKDRQKMAVTEKNSKEAITHYEVLEEYPRYSLVQVKLETGRTHQIRVHFSTLGHPLLGDFVYGKSSPWIEGQCLHAQKLGFSHPITGAYLEFIAPPPEEFLYAKGKAELQK